MEFCKESIDHMLDKIVNDLKKAFSSNPNIDEFDIIPWPDISQKNKQPVIQIGTKIGLESWCIKYLFKYCHNIVLPIQKDYNKIEEDKAFMVKLMLLLMPEILTLWNLRKKWFSLNLISVDEELRLTELILARKPKCLEVFNHRKWIHTQSKIRDDDERFQINNSILHELEICSAAANRYPNNYHAWSHRMWMIQNFSSTNKLILENELETTKLWCERHVSDHSGLQYREFLLKNISSNSTKSDNISFHKLLLDEIEFCNQLILSYPGHEALWSHRRFILHHLLNDAEGNISDIKRSKLDNHTANNSPYTVADEKKFMTVASNKNVDNDHENFLINRHKNWLNKFFQAC